MSYVVIKKIKCCHCKKSKKNWEFTELDLRFVPKCRECNESEKLEGKNNVK